MVGRRPANALVWCIGWSSCIWCFDWSYVVLIIGVLLRFKGQSFLKSFPLLQSNKDQPPIVPLLKIFFKVLKILFLRRIIFLKIERFYYYWFFSQFQFQNLILYVTIEIQIEIFFKVLKILFFRRIIFLEIERFYFYWFFF